jgi:hypothetical protein
MVHEPVHIVHLFTAHTCSVHFFEFQINYCDIPLYPLINKQIGHLFGV